MIRPATASDIPVLLAIAQERYPPFDLMEARAWLDHAIRSQDMIVIRSERAAAVATVAKAFWGGPLRCHLLFLVAQRAPGLSRRSFDEGLALMRAIDVWRQTKGADSLHFGEETGANFEVLARMLGAKKDRPSYTLGGSPLSFAAALFRDAPREREASPPLRNAVLQALRVG